MQLEKPFQNPRPVQILIRTIDKKGGKQKQVGRSYCVTVYNTSTEEMKRWITQKIQEENG